jgi:hypothetical protein
MTSNLMATAMDTQIKQEMQEAERMDRLVDDERGLWTNPWASGNLQERSHGERHRFPSRISEFFFWSFPMLSLANIASLVRERYQSLGMDL